MQMSFIADLADPTIFLAFVMDKNNFSDYNYTNKSNDRSHS